MAAVSDQADSAENRGAPRGVNVDAVTAWMAERLPHLEPPLTFDLIAGGHSNLTFRVTDRAQGAYVLRRPPLHQVLATAHDMRREHTVIAALQDSAVPVPRVIGLCTDEAVNDQPFYVMGFVEGLVIRNRAEAEPLSNEFKQLASRSVVETLAAIHDVDIDLVGLDGLGKREDYVARQLRRWKRQYDESKTVERAGMNEIHDHLVSRIPDQQGATIVHGDYRLDNTIVSAPGTADAGSVVAVLDWEICTLGDPLVDIAQLVTYWAEPDDPASALVDSPTSSPGFWSRDQVIDTYRGLSSRSLDGIDYYLAFAAWKLAAILEGVYSRYVGGAMGDKVPSGGTDSFVTSIESLISRAEAAAERVP